jgi:hypothetical protein
MHNRLQYPPRLLSPDPCLPPHTDSKPVRHSSTHFSRLLSHPHTFRKRPRIAFVQYKQYEVGPLAARDGLDKLPLFVICDVESRIVDYLFQLPISGVGIRQ